MGEPAGGGGSAYQSAMLTGGVIIDLFPIARFGFEKPGYIVSPVCTLHTAISCDKSIEMVESHDDHAIGVHVGLHHSNILIT